MESREFYSLHLSVFIRGVKFGLVSVFKVTTVFDLKWCWVGFVKNLVSILNWCGSVLFL